MGYTLLGNPIGTTYILSFKSYNTNHDDGGEQHYTDINTNIQGLKRVH